jgi:hypothetical protein
MSRGGVFSDQPEFQRLHFLAPPGQEGLGEVVELIILNVKAH